ncbi:cystatin-like isoform X2 [Phyllobates terribilis]|uniref:cystatin-like isoform X2 n=1 Tax=Phyllobates terribilis TaxID=111132 RepID=UPI003CCAC3DA
MSAGMCGTALVALSLLSVCVYGDMLVGGLQQEDPSDPEVVKAATFAVSGFNKLSNAEYIYKLMKIVSAESQIVAGIRYVLNVEIGETACKRVSTSETGSCDLFQDPTPAKTLLCTFTVLDVPWENEESLLSSSCRVMQ